MGEVSVEAAFKVELGRGFLEVRASPRPDGYRQLCPTSAAIKLRGGVRGRHPLIRVHHLPIADRRW